MKTLIAIASIITSILAPGAVVPPAEEPPTVTATIGVKELPTLSYIYNETTEHRLIGEYMQEAWERELGLKVKLEIQDWAVVQENRTLGNYDIARDGWLGDYSDPMTFLEIFASDNKQNNPHYNNSAFDEQIEIAKTETDQATRMTALHKAEGMLMEDMPIIPIYYYNNPWLDNGKVQGTVFDPLLGNSVFMWASKADGTPIHYGIGSSPRTLDPQLNNATDGANIIQSTMEGLTRKNKNNEIEPGVAESWDVSSDGLVWTFHLRDDAVWNDGKPVTAYDFDYALHRLLDPANYAEYAYQAMYIKNAEAVYSGDAELSELGVKVIDDRTLEITLEEPCGYFTQITAFTALYPVRQDIVEANPDWSKSPETYVCNGPYKMTEFTPFDQIKLVKNESYWDSANYPCPEVTIYLTSYFQDMFYAFETGEADIIEDFALDELQNMKDLGFYRSEAILGTYYVSINMDSDIDALSEQKVRKAMSLAIDREGLAEAIGYPYLPAYAFVPPGIPDADGTDFNANAPHYFGSGDYEADCEEARALLREAGYRVPEK